MTSVSGCAIYLEYSTYHTSGGTALLTSWLAAVGEGTVIGLKPVQRGLLPSCSEVWLLDHGFVTGLARVCHGFVTGFRRPDGGRFGLLARVLKPNYYQQNLGGDFFLITLSLIELDRSGTGKTRAS